MALPSALTGPWNPFRISGTPMPPNLLLLCKVLALALLATRHVFTLPDPFLPFIPGLDQLAEPDVFRTTLRATAVAAAVALLFNRWVRASALTLGTCMLVAVVSSKAYYGNNKTFVGLSLVLAGLSDFDRPPYLLRWQLALTYFGAALNKLLDPDWQSGLFFDYWASSRLKNPVYLTVAGWLPPLVAGKVMCWSTIAAEFAASLGLLVRRWVPYALWVNILFQVGLLEFTGTTFTLFFYAMLAATLAFVTWPDRVLVFHDDARPGMRRWRCLLTLFDPDGFWDWRPQAGAGLQVLDGGTTFAGLAAVQRLLLWSPVVWLTLTALLAIGDTAWWRRGLVAVVLISFLPLWRPLAQWLQRRWQGRPGAARGLVTPYQGER
jgi:hypothetical protein